MGHRFSFIEPSRPEPMALRDTLIASLAATVIAPADNIELAGALSDEIFAADEANGALLDAETDAEAAPALTEIKRRALTVLALVAAYEAR